ncbi:MAG: hypothetical protein AAGG51_28500 [Cyanobacteria bacterium P01_G01_bin.54]
MPTQPISPQVQQLFDAACALAPDEQSLLLELLQQQTLVQTQRDSELSAEIRAVHQELKMGHFRSGSVDDFLAELDN